MSSRTESLNIVIAKKKDLTIKSKTVDVHVNSCVVNSVLLSKDIHKRKV